MKRCTVNASTELGYPSEYTSFNAFEAAEADGKTPVTVIIHLDPETIEQVNQFTKHKFYEFNFPEIYLFTSSGILLGYHKESNWVTNIDGFDSLLSLNEIEASVLNDLIEETINKLNDVPNEDEKQRQVDTIMKIAFTAIADKIAGDKNYLDHIEWRDLERVLGEALSTIGFQVTVTPPAKDGGKDIIANLQISNKHYSFIIELKHWRSGQRVGSKHVERFLRVVINDKPCGGLLLATYGYTKDCTELLCSLKQYKLNLGAGDRIYSIFQLYRKKRNGIVVSPSEMLGVVT